MLTPTTDTPVSFPPPNRAALRRILGDLADTPGVTRAGDLVIKAGTSARTEGRALYAAVRTLPLPTEPVARLWHGANLLREHRGDGHIAALLTERIVGTEAHVLHALSEGIPAEDFGRVSRLPHAQLAAVIDGMRARGLIGADGWLTAAGRQTKERVETLTDELAAPAYDTLEPDELDQLVRNPRAPRHRPRAEPPSEIPYDRTPLIASAAIPGSGHFSTQEHPLTVDIREVISVRRWPRTMGTRCPTLLQPRRAVAACSRAPHWLSARWC